MKGNTMTDFKPGDVAILPANLSEPHTVFMTSNGWVDGDGDPRRGLDFFANQIRSLVVIDPEDREQVGDLVNAYRGQPKWYSATARESVDCMQAALREFATPTPPRIDEPGTWGVVEASCIHTANRFQWVHDPDGYWHQIGGPNAPDDWDSLVDPVLIREGI